MKYILRLLTLPFIFGVVFIGYNYSLICHLIHFVRYGGEWITFNKDSKDTIRELFNKIENTPTIKPIESND